VRERELGISYLFQLAITLEPELSDLMHTTYNIIILVTKMKTNTQRYRHIHSATINTS